MPRLINWNSQEDNFKLGFAACLLLMGGTKEQALKIFDEKDKKLVS